MAPPRTITALTTIALTGAAVVAFAALPQQTGNVDLLTQANIRIDGAAGGDGAGLSVAPAGDVNGDGRQDIIIAARLADNNGRALSGSVYVVYGAATPTNLDLLDLAAPSTRGFRIDGAAVGDQAGESVAPAGDVNGDRRDDILIGANGADNNGRVDSGSAYVVYGSAAPTNLDLATLAAPTNRGFRIDGAASGDTAGVSVAAAGDVNGDGRQDILVGTPFAGNNGRATSGSAYVVYGSAAPTNLDLADLAAPSTRGFRIDGAAVDDQAGESVAPAGDVNGDGRQDILIGAYQADNNARGNSGSAYVVYGSATPANLDLLDLAAPSTRGFRIDGAAVADNAGFSVAAAGDANGDGRDDILIGARLARNNGRFSSGSGYVVYGSAAPTNLDLVTLAAPSTRGFRIDGAAASNQAGWSVAGAGDVNGDGRQDILIGARLAGNNGRNGSGSGYVVYGAATPANVDLAALGTGGFRIDGAADVDQAGTSVAGAGDVNGDGRQDILIGANGADNNARTDSGSGYVVYGFGAPSVTYPAITATTGQPITPTTPVVRRTGDAAFTATGLPTGLVVDPTTGTLTGTPTTPGSTAATVVMTDLAGTTQATLTITVTSPPQPPAAAPAPLRRLIVDRPLPRLRLSERLYRFNAFCSETCTLRASMRVGVRGGTRFVALPTPQRRGLRLGSGTATTTTLFTFPTGKARPGALKGLAAGRKVVAKVTVVATFPDGQRRSITRFTTVTR